MNRKTLLIVAMLASMVCIAHAQNLVLNPGFETGNFMDWTQAGDLSFTTVNGNVVHSGNFSAELGPLTAGTLSQLIPTVAGQSYNVDFWLQNTFTGVNAFAATFAGIPVITALVNSPAFPYTEFSLNITAITNSSLLLFTFSNPPSYWHLDDVSVTQVVPEPGTVGLIALGALGLVAVVRKRRSF